MWVTSSPMMPFLNLTRRTFLLIAVSIGLALAVAQVSGVLCTAPLESVAGGLILSLVLTQGVSMLQAATYRDLMNAVLESERTGQFAPNFPVTSSSPQVKRLSMALNAAASSVIESQGDLDGAYLQFVETMAQALDARDPYTAGHSLRVAEYSHTLAVAMGLSDDEAERIHVAAQLHDIGKIGIPDAVLQKPGALSADEYGLIKLHPQIGRKILEKVGRFSRLLNVVELHHENHDGTGYPYGLAGDAIPMDARIVHVADAFDAMTTSRSYRSALPLRAAIMEIERNAGFQFDPTAAKTFLRLIAEGSIEIGGLEFSKEISGMEILERVVA
jgi:HD-GYP domain-containing protein (c-di-GMP phosphodiesterase class II)